MVKKRKLVVDDDEDLDPRTDHLCQKRGDTTLTRTPVRSNRIIVDDISESEEFTNTQYEVTGGRRLGRHCFAGPSGAQLEGRSSSRLAADNLQSSQQSSTMHVRFHRGVATPEELDIVLQQLGAPCGEPQLEDLNNWNRPIQQPRSSRQGMENTLTRQMGYSSAIPGGNRSLQLAGNHSFPSNREYGQPTATGDSGLHPRGSRSLQPNGNNPIPPGWEYNQHPPTHRRAVYDTLVPSTEVVFPTLGYDQNMAPSQAVQDNVFTGSVHAAAPDFNFDTIQEEASSRYPSSPWILSERSTSSGGSQVGAMSASLGQGYPTWAYPTDGTVPDPSGNPYNGAV